MTNYPAPLDQQWASDQADLLRRLRTLEMQVAQLTSGTVACTSTTHPANPAVGTQIYETDTGLTAMWNGSAWEYPPQLIQNQTVTGSAASSITFSPIPSVFTFLRLEWRVHLTAGGPTDLLMQVDGNTASQYVWAKMEATNAVQNNQHANAAVASMKVGAVSDTTAQYFASGSLSIAGWSTSTGFLSVSGTSTLFDSNTNDYIGTYGALLATNGPHSSIKLFPASSTFIVGSQFSLYGMT